MTENYNSQKWASFLNPDIVRMKFASAGLFLVGYELLMGSIKDRPRSFFSYQWGVNGSIPSPDYESEILILDPKGKKDIFRGSIAWLRKMDAIDEADEVAIRELTDARNKIAHEMIGLISGRSEIEFTTYFPTLLALVNKIEKWWIVNFEIDTNPDFQGQEIDEASVVPGTALIMDMLMQVALGDGEEAWRLQRMFEEQWPTSKRPE